MATHVYLWQRFWSPQATPRARRATAERAVDLYERKGAAALADKARAVLSESAAPAAPGIPEVPEPPSVELDNAAVRVGERVMAAIHRKDWDEFERLFAPEVSIESRRKVVGLTLSSDTMRGALRREIEMGTVRFSHVMVAARGERLALSRNISSSPDSSPGAPQDELLQLYAIDDEGRVSHQVWFDVEDLDAALAELDAMHARFEEQAHRQGRMENAASRVCQRFESYLLAENSRAVAETLAGAIAQDDRRRLVGGGLLTGRDAVMAEIAVVAQGLESRTTDVIAVRGEHLVLNRVRASFRDERPDAFRHRRP